MPHALASSPAETRIDTAGRTDREDAGRKASIRPGNLLQALVGQAELSIFIQIAPILSLDRTRQGLRVASALAQRGSLLGGNPSSAAVILGQGPEGDYIVAEGHTAGSLHSTPLHRGRQQDADYLPDMDAGARTQLVSWPWSQALPQPHAGWPSRPGRGCQASLTASRNPEIPHGRCSSPNTLPGGACVLLGYPVRSCH